MQPVPKSISKQKSSHQHLRLGVLAPDPAHVVAPYLGFVYVGHSGCCGTLKVAITLEDLLVLIDSEPNFLHSPPKKAPFAD